MSNINISLSANTAAYTQRLREARTETDRNIIQMERRIDQFARDVNANFTSVDGSINAMLNSLGNMKGGGYVAGFIGIGVAASNLAGAIHQVNVQAVQNEKELKKAATRARMTITEFQDLARATTIAGVDMEKLSDISKDVFDRMGDYTLTGNGAMKDFFETIKDGSVTMKDFEGKNAIEVISLMVSEMEKAGKTGAEITFMLESMGNDLSDLQPLLVNNAEGLKTLQKRMEDVANTPFVSKEAAMEIEVLNLQFTNMWDNFGVLMTEKFGWLYTALGDFASKVGTVLGQMSLSDDIEKIESRLPNGKMSFKIKAEGDLASLEQQGFALKEMIRLRKEQIELDKQNSSSFSGHSAALVSGKSKAEYEAEIADLEKLTVLNQKRIDEQLATQTAVSTAKLKEVEAEKLKKKQQAEEAATRKTQNEIKKREKAELDSINKILSARMNFLQQEVQSAVTNSEKINAVYALETEKRIQELNAGKINRDQYNDYLLNADYARYMAEQEMKAEAIVGDEERDMFKAERSLEFWEAAREAERISEAEHNELRLQDEKNYTDAKRALTMSQLGMMEQALSGISNLAKEGSTAQKALFAVEKSATLAKLGMQMWEAWGAVDSDPTLITQASKTMAKAGVIAQYGGAIATVSSQALGQFHSGTDEVDQTGSYILKKGERVVQETANKDLTAFLDSNKSGSNAINVEAPLNIQGDTTITEGKLLSMMVEQREQIARMVQLAQRENPSM